MSSINASSTIGQTLGQADLLKLLVTQMTSQDPLHPQSGTDFIAQLAQFSSLSSATSTQNAMATLQANNLIGRTVTVKNADTTQSTGQVSAVQMDSGTPELVINGKMYAMNQVVTIQPTATTSI